MRAALAGRALAGGGRLDEIHAGHELAHLVDDAAVGGDDVFPGPEAFGRLDDAGSRSHGVRERDHAARRLGVHQYLRVRVQRLQFLELLRLELIVHDA